jgi:putative addiction module component (TIGR02574 family)
MANAAREILELAKQLTATERASVARDLLATLDSGPEITPESADATWRSEARRRAEAILRGESSGVAAEAVHAQIADRLASRK